MLKIFLVSSAALLFNTLAFAEEVNVDAIFEEAQPEMSFTEDMDVHGLNQYYPPYPQPNYGYLCYARDNREGVYAGRAWSQQQAAQQALNNCYRYSRYCQVTWCQYGN